jgi:hypothetical protein
MKFIIGRSSIGARMRIRPRRGIASRCGRWLMDVSASSREWGRSPIALAWRRRQRERAIPIVRARSVAAGPVQESTRTLENRRETWLTLTRLFERYVSFESRSAISAHPRLSASRAAARAISPAEHMTTGPRRRVATPPHIDRAGPFNVRPLALAAAVPSTSPSLASPPLTVAPWPRRPVHASSRVSPEGRLAARNQRQSAASAAPSQIQRAGPQHTSSPTRSRRSIDVATRPIGAASPGRRLTAARATIVGRSARGAASSSPEIASAAAVAMAVPSPPLVWRTTPSPAPQAATRPGRPLERSATPDSTALNQHLHGSASSSMPIARTTDIARAAMPPLSGPVMDRLADDVMQRIERRMRIERERRGL